MDSAQLINGDSMLKTPKKDSPAEVSPRTPLPLRTPEGMQDRVVLTTYPGQVGIRPLPIVWGAKTALERGPILASRLPAQNLKRHNAIGSYGGSYCIYHALAVAIGDLSVVQHRADYTNAEPPFTIGPYPQWHKDDSGTLSEQGAKDLHSSASIPKIVSIDPWGHLAPWIFKDIINQEELDIRPTMAITRAHIRLPELGKGSFPVDGTIVVGDGGELVVSKVAAEPVWWLPGVAARFGIDETTLRRTLFEDTNGMYTELITRPDLKVFLPPIGGLTAYIFGPVEKLSDPNVPLTLRIHDECNGSDVFGSDICTCRPYLTHGIKLCVETAQAGGVGLIVYFRKEGRALGEVTKYLVYNARKQQAGGDRASTYFKRTESIAGVKDMRFHALMPDILHWFGIRHIHKLVSMSNIKHEAIVKSGITVGELVPIPPDMLPPDSQVEIDAKVASGYFTTGKVPTFNELEQVKGRDWDDLVH